MQNGTVFLYKDDVSKPLKIDIKDIQFWYGLVGKAINFFTGKPYVHVKVLINGKTYESTVWVDNSGKLHNGLKITEGEPTDYYSYVEPLFPEEFTRARIAAFEYYMNEVAKDRLKYNFFGLVVLAIVYPTRHLWRAIGWVPFSNRYVWGDFCSSFVDGVVYKKGLCIDLFKDEKESYTAPADFLNSWFLSEEKIRS